jgi:uncharacterized protein (DUF983 family)
MMFKKLLLGFFLRCPNCEKGSISDGLFSIRERCEVCHVVYERRSGESVGASAIWMMGLPIVPLLLFFVLIVINDKFSTWILLGIPLLVTVLIGVLGYRHMRGLWIAFAYLTGGVYADEDAPADNI